YQAALREAGIPAGSFDVEDIQQEYERLKGHGVVFTTEPTTADWGTYAVFDDTCGNLINLHQLHRA
ncbi:MAG: VOC family protein, partial [Chloroflexota bacterium]|nr:VOC family protein [Chloroflexota bacterium]